MLQIVQAFDREPIAEIPTDDAGRARGEGGSPAGASVADPRTGSPEGGYGPDATLC